MKLIQVLYTYIERLKEDLNNYIIKPFTNSPIGNINDKIYQINDTINYKWRSILGDGNCFYRCFMFSILEILILQSDEYEIMKIIFDIYNIVEINFESKNIVIDKNHLCSILLIIVNELQQGHISKAYEIFIKSYSIYKNFDYVIYS